MQPRGAIMLTVITGLLAAWSMPSRADRGRFAPIREADLPAGFPPPTPVGEIQIKRYPGYRKAQADASSGNPFWRLFAHIKRNQIAMTAPVEMTYEAAETSAAASMAFLYGRKDLGRLGRQGQVDVVDMPAMTVVSIGVRGPRRAASVAHARQQIQDWLAANQSRYAVCGPWRVMAHNSPFIPPDRNYFEVQVPVKRVDSE